MNKGSKPSVCIFIGQAAAVIDATLYAFCIGRWLNRSITIHFGKAGVRSHDNAHALLTDFLKHGGDWLSKRGHRPPYYVYSFENPDKSDEQESFGGLHVHILLHVPRDEWKPFVRFERRWIKRAVKEAGGRYQRGVLVDGPVFFCAEFMRGIASLSDYIEEGLLGSLLYLLKGGEAGTPALLGLDEEAVKRLPPRLQPSPQGIIFGKRVGFSEALSRQRHVFPLLEIRPGMWMAGREAHSRATLRMFGLQFASRPLSYPALAVYEAEQRI